MLVVSACLYLENSMTILGVLVLALLVGAKAWDVVTDRGVA